ncbi:MAG TPA: hypothetical protein VKN18_06840 [Blastocatellia bacterium]|nr:hypothetical protein [Blastocatellia bacterium]
MQAGLASLIAAAGEVFERDFMGAGEVIVERVGQSHVRHVFTVNGRAIARLRWHGLRRAVYEVDGKKWDIKVGVLGKRISIISEEGGESFLVERSRANPNKEGLRIEMAEGDNFCLKRSWDSRLRADASLVINKEFYCSKLLVFHFNMRHRTQTTARVLVNPVMKWEARFIHRLLALTVCRIILERRNSGCKPLRTKEMQDKRFESSARVRERKRI